MHRIDVAGLSFAVHASTPALDLALKPYGSQGGEAGQPPDEVVRFDEGPKALRRENGELRVSSPANEITAGLRGMLVSALDQRGGALLHGAAAIVEGRAVLCVAPSEGGKTTLCHKLGGRVAVLSDETIALWSGQSPPAIAGTFFWSGESLPTQLGLFPLGAICFLAKGGEGLSPIDRAEALRALLTEWHLPERSTAAEDALAAVDRLLSTVPFARLNSRLETDPLPLLLAANRLARTDLKA